MCLGCFDDGRGFTFDLDYSLGPIIDMSVFRDHERCSIKQER